MSGDILKHGLVQQLGIELIDDSPFQVRLDYGDIEGLAADIKKRGLLQPILVRPKGNRFEVVHGHRRLQAVRVIGSKYILGMVRELDDESAIVIQGAENIKRKDLSHIEQGMLFRSYIKKTGKSTKATAREFEVSEDTIADKIALLDLPSDIQKRVHDGEIPLEKARALTILTREPDTTAVVSGRSSDGKFIGGGSQPAVRTEKHYEDIKHLADEAIKYPQDLAKAAQKIREGKTYDEAIKEAVQERQIKQFKNGGRPPEAIAAELKSKIFNQKEFDDLSKKQYTEILQEIVKRGWFICPNCGEHHLVCSKCGVEIK